jgi:Holliday junction DNA helicase RuvA
MISRLRGEVVTRRRPASFSTSAVSATSSIPTDSARRKAEPGGEVVLETYLHVREDALQLFGFAETAERELFELLLSVQGVGPKVALAIVSGSTPDELRRAITLEDTARFQAIPGIGKKTAERVVLELKERLGSVGEAQGATPLAPKTHLVARDALVELGYSLAEAETRLPARIRTRPRRNACVRRCGKPHERGGRRDPVPGPRDPAGGGRARTLAAAA